MFVERTDKDEISRFSIFPAERSWRLAEPKAAPGGPKWNLQYQRMTAWVYTALNQGCKIQIQGYTKPARVPKWKSGLEIRRIGDGGC